MSGASNCGCYKLKLSNWKVYVTWTLSPLSHRILRTVYKPCNHWKARLRMMMWAEIYSPYEKPCKNTPMITFTIAYPVTNWQTDWTRDGLTDWLTEWPTGDWATGEQTDRQWVRVWLTDQLTDIRRDCGLINLLCDWITDPPTDWLSVWLSD